MSTAGNNLEYFYTPPLDSQFEELRRVCIWFWETLYKEDVEYMNEKVDRLKNLKNEGANFISMVQMIHHNLRPIIAKQLSLKTRFEISKRLYGPASENEFDCFSVWKSDNIFGEL